MNFLSGLSGLSGIFASGAGGGGGGTLTNNLVSYYHLGNVNDSVGGNTLTLRGSSYYESNKIIVPNGVGPINMSAFSNNLNGNLYYSGNNLDFNNTSFTISVWVKPFDIVATQIIAGQIGSFDALLDSSYALYVDGASGKFKFLVNNGVDSSSVVNTTIVNNTWYHLLAEYDVVTQKVSLSVNGNTPVVASTTSSVVGGRGYRFNIGGTQSDTVLVNGRISELGIWNRKLTSLEKASLLVDIYPWSGNTRPEFLPDHISGLIGWWLPSPNYVVTTGNRTYGTLAAVGDKMSHLWDLSDSAKVDNNYWMDMGNHSGQPDILLGQDGITNAYYSDLVSGTGYFVIQQGNLGYSLTGATFVFRYDYDAGATSNNNWPIVHFLPSDQWDRYSDGNAYLDFYLANRITATGKAAPIGKNTIMYRSDSSGFSRRLNSVTDITAAADFSNKAGGAYIQGCNSTSYFGPALMYSRALTDGEALQVEAYLESIYP